MAWALLGSPIEAGALHTVGGAECFDAGLGGVFGAFHFDEIARIDPFGMQSLSRGPIRGLSHPGAGSVNAAIGGSDSVRHLVLTLCNV